jgi:hypothetical protein
MIIVTIIDEVTFIVTQRSKSDIIIDEVTFIVTQRSKSTDVFYTSFKGRRYSASKLPTLGSHIEKLLARQQKT